MKKIYIAVFTLYVLLPVMVIILLSFSDSTYLEFPPKSFSFAAYHSAFVNPLWRNAFFLTLKVAAVNSVCSTAVGLSFVIGIEKTSTFIRSFALLIVLLPLLMPAIIIGVALFFLFSDVSIIGTSLSLILAHALISYPIAVWVISVGNRNINPEFDKTSQTLGGDVLKTFFSIRLPLLKPALVTSLILTFITSFDEPVLALFISGIKNTTLPKAMWDGIRYEINPSILAISASIIVFTAFLTLSIRFINSNNEEYSEH